MAVTYSSTLLTARKSIFTGACVCIASTNTETITLVHQLGASPHTVIPVIRSIVSAPSFNPTIQAVTWNASQATLTFQSSGVIGASNAMVDIICTLEHSIVQ